LPVSLPSWLPANIFKVKSDAWPPSLCLHLALTSFGAKPEVQSPAPVQKPNPNISNEQPLAGNKEIVPPYPSSRGSGNLLTHCNTEH